MARTNYQVGYYYERKCQKELEEKGYNTFRTAGSHSVLDVLAMKKKELRLIQVKSTKSKSRNYAKEELEMKMWTNHPISNPFFKVNKELWVWRFRKGWEIISI